MARVMEICPFCEGKFHKQGLPMHSRFCQTKLNKGGACHLVGACGLHHFRAKAEEEECVYVCVCVFIGSIYVQCQ